MENKLPKLLAIISYSFIYMPIIVLICYSFNGGEIVSVWQGFSLRWYHKIWQDEILFTALKNSFYIALICASLSAVLGLIIGFVLAKIKFTTKSFFGYLVSIPIVMPEIIMGFMMLMLYSILKNFTLWPNKLGNWSIIIAHMTICISYVSILMRMRIQTLDISLEEAALDLGASPLTTFYYIILPILLPTLISGFLLSFIISFDDLIIASFTAEPGITTLPMLIYSRIKTGLNPEMNVVGSIVIITTFIITFLAIYIKNDNEK